jgi:hypothetical protein
VRLLIILTNIASFTFGQSNEATLRCEKVLDNLTNREIYNSIDAQADMIGGLINSIPN